MEYETVNTVLAAARLGDVEKLEELLDAGRPCYFYDKKGWKPLHHAAFEGHKECVEILLAQGKELLYFTYLLCQFNRGCFFQIIVITTRKH